MENKHSNMKRVLSLLVFIGVVFLMTQLMRSCGNATPTPDVNEPDYSCVRHIYNRTSCPWTFTATNGAGNVWFIDDAGCGLDNCPNPNGPCTVPPNCTISIQYTTTNGVIQGNLFATDQNYDSRGWQYSASYPAFQCPYINHSGNTGAIALNAPANGDLAASACTW